MNCSIVVIIIILYTYRELFKNSKRLIEFNKNRYDYHLDRNVREETFGLVTGYRGSGAAIREKKEMSFEISLKCGNRAGLLEMRRERVSELGGQPRKVTFTIRVKVRWG